LATRKPGNGVKTGNLNMKTVIFLIGAFVLLTTVGCEAPEGHREHRDQGGLYGYERDYPQTRSYPDRPGYGYQGNTQYWEHPDYH